MQLSDTELNVDAQRAALESFAIRHDKKPESDDSAEGSPKKV